MGVLIDISKNVILQDIRREGKAEGKAEIVRSQLKSRFGALPAWAEQRISKAGPTDLDRWAKRLLNAETLKVVLGER